MLHPCWRASLNMQHIKPWSVRGPQWRNTLEVVASQLNYSIQSLCGVTSSPCGCTQSPGTQRGDWIPAGQENVWFYVALVWEDIGLSFFGFPPSSPSFLSGMNNLLVSSLSPSLRCSEGLMQSGDARSAACGKLFIIPWTSKKESYETLLTGNVVHKVDFSTIPYFHTCAVPVVDAHIKHGPNFNYWAYILYWDKLSKLRAVLTFCLWGAANQKTASLKEEELTELL